MSFEQMRLFFGLLTVGANLAVLTALFLLVGGRFSDSVLAARRHVLAAIAGRELLLAFVVATAATLGSLYLSEIAHLVPCAYCWYQRIAMYPLVVLFGIAAWKNDHGVSRYAVPIAGAGGVISLIHYGLQNDWPVLSSFEGTSCSVVVPCSAKYLEQFGFMSIPYMALSAFALILMLMVGRRLNDNTEADETAGSQTRPISTTNGESK
jgi:disulfide bond formation protein DsbB